jgi:hypothetical protein
MSTRDAASDLLRANHLRRAALVLLALISAVLYGMIAKLSPRFHFNTDFAQRPIPAVLALLGAAFVVYLVAVAVCRRSGRDRPLLVIVFVSSLAFRLILLPSTPIQEVDIYRYLWDGVVLSHGVNPYRYTPQEVRTASLDTAHDAELATLVRLRDVHPPLQTVLARVHYGELPSVYPPVSQVVFAMAARSTPRDASLHARVIVMKAWLLGCDMATLALVMWLLRSTGRPVGLCVIYGWCPLLLKEVANSGHLDAIAVLLTTLVACWMVRLVLPGRADHQRYSVLVAVLASFTLALAIGAKLYPVVLAPLLGVAVWKRLGWRWFAVGLLVFVGTTALVMWPMLVPSWHGEEGTGETPAASEAESPSARSETGGGDPSRGLQAFLSRWEMNDFLFLLVLENVKPADVVPADQQAWFSVVPESLRGVIVDPVSRWFRVDRWAAAFLVARAVTLLVLAALVLWLGWRSAGSNDAGVWLESAFLTLAWFWLLSPTLNPWYWTWALPLLPFARSRAWLAVSGLVLLYYLRFWLIYQFPEALVILQLPGGWKFETPYAGMAFFDLVVTWIEFGPWLVCLLAGWMGRKWRGPRAESAA